MKNTKNICKYYLLIAILISNCSPSQAQLEDIELRKENENLFISNNRQTVILKNVLVDQANGYFKKGKNGVFYIIYEYYASYNKSMVIYSLFIKQQCIHINKVIHINYNDREGIPYGWIYYCNKKEAYEDVDYDKLTEIKSQMKYSSFVKNNQLCSAEISSSKKKTKSYTVKKDESINLHIPLFYQDGNYIGEGVFRYQTDNLSNLSMNFCIENFEKDYFIPEKDIDNTNVVHFNNIAYYLEQSKSYIESIYILKEIIDRFPNRTVAYINLGDAYWGLGETSKAKQAYERYISLMKTNGKESKIPKRIFERINEGG